MMLAYSFLKLGLLYGSEVFVMFHYCDLSLDAFDKGVH